MNSAFTLCIDNNERLWIGTQGCGIERIDHLDDYLLKTRENIVNNTEMVNFHHQKVIYDLTKMSDGHIHISAGDTTCAQYGPDGALWIATRENGILRIQENKSLFHRLASGVIRSLYTDNGRQFYIGLGMEGVAWFDTVTGQMRKGNLVPGYDALPKEGFSTRVTSIVRRHNGELWMAAGDNGILIRVC